MTSRPVLLAVAHGTRSVPGQAQICRLVDTVARRRPDLDVRLSYVDVQEPRLPDVTARLTGRTVVVPLLLSSGYHVRVDVGRAVAAMADRAVDATATAPLGPHPWLVDVLAARIATAGAADPGAAAGAADAGPAAAGAADFGAADAVVLAAAGSSDPRSRADVAAVAAALPVPATVAYASTSDPRVPDVVARLRAEGARRIVIAAYLLADGLFYRSLHRAGADAVTAPLVTSPTVAALLLHRYDSAVADDSAVALARATP